MAVPSESSPVQVTIKKPSTSNDSGIPSSSCTADIKRVFRFIEDERHLIANGLYQDVLSRIALATTAATAAASQSKKFRLRKSKASTQREEQTKDIKEAEEIIASKQDVLDHLVVSYRLCHVLTWLSRMGFSLFLLLFFVSMQRRCRLFAKARQNLLDDNHWTLAQTLFGITTYYRNETNGTLSIKMEGQLEGVSLFDQVAVLREVDLHYKWAPFVSSSLTIAHLDKLDTVGWFALGLPSFGLMRDACFRAIGCDSMFEDGSILLVAQGINDRPKSQNANADSLSPEEAEELIEFEYLSKDPILDTLDLPDPPTRMGSGRITLRTFQSLIQVESPTSARTLIIANVDPNLPFVPHSLLDFIMKKLCGVLLNKLQHAAKRVSKDPVNNPHASKMRQEEIFYKHWLLPKFEAVCKLRKWSVPVVSSFELSDQQMELAEEADAKKLRSKSNNKTLRVYHSVIDDTPEDFMDDNSGPRSAPVNIGRRGPRVRSTTEDSVLSDISRNSSSISSVWQNNPIASYLRELEENTQMRKAKEIRHSRERAAHRLKPKPLDEDAKSRLEELRKARQRRETGSLSVATNEPDTLRDLGTASTEVSKEHQKSDVATLLKGHGTLPRLIVMTTLVVSLFLFLSLGPWMENWMAERITPFNSVYGRDLFALFYLAVSGLLHFVMNYVSLMYAFSALYIGSVAGREALRFYSQNIHMILGIFSSSLITLGILRASVISVLRWSIYKSTLLADYMTEHLESGWSWTVDVMPDKAVSTISVLVGLANTVLRVSITSILTGLRWLVAVLIDSNVVGQSVWRAILVLIHPFGLGWSWASTFVHNSIEAYMGRLDVPGWREEACSASRFLLSYSGIFVLVVVLLFTMFARSSRSLPAKDKTFDDRESDSLLGNNKFSDELPAVQSSLISSPDSTPYRSRTGSRSMSPVFETIDEGGEDGFEDAFQEYGDAEKYSQGTSVKKRLRLKNLVRRVRISDEKQPVSKA